METNASNNKKPDRIKKAEAQMSQDSASAPVIGGKTNDGKQRIEKKYWKLHDVKNGYTLEFFPIYIIQGEKDERPGEVEVRNLEVVFTDKDGKKHEMLFDWMNLYMFAYYTANEELRQQLATRYERKVAYIPYDVKFPVTREDLARGFVERRVELPVDELTMAIAREEAWKVYTKDHSKMGDPSAFRYQPKKR